MLLEKSGVRFTRQEAARALRIPQEILDALIKSGLVASSAGYVSASALEKLLRDSLLRLYRAEARADEIEIELPHTRDESEEIELDVDTEIVRQSLADYQTEELHNRPNQRIVARYKPRRQLGGMFRQTRFSVMQLSESGLRIRHDESLRPGDEARVTFSLVNPARTFALKARVVWTSIAQRGGGPSFCISGLHAIAGEDQLREAVRLLILARELESDDEKPATETTHKLPAGALLQSLSDDDVASIIRTMRMLTSDPVEANRWYARARFALADEEIRAAAPVRARDREEALAVWEYLGRRVELKAVAGVLSWIRSTRSAAAV